MIRKNKTILIAILGITGVVTTYVVSISLNSINGMSAIDCDHSHVEHYLMESTREDKKPHKEHWACCNCHTAWADENRSVVIGNTLTDRSKIDYDYDFYDIDWRGQITQKDFHTYKTKAKSIVFTKGDYNPNFHCGETLNDLVSYSFDEESKTLTISSPYKIRFMDNDVILDTGIFDGFTELTSIDLNNINTTELTNAKRMFYNCNSLTGITNLKNIDSSSFITMNSMFELCSNINHIDLSRFDTSNVTNFQNTFNGCSTLKTIYVTDAFVTSKAIEESSSDMMFGSCNTLVGGNGTKVSSKQIYDKTYAKIDKTDQEGYFTEKDASEKYIEDMDITQFSETQFLYEASFSEYDYTWGEQYLHSRLGKEKKLNGLCSTVASNGFFGRNFDYEYSYAPDFIVHTTKKENRHASLGVSFSLFLNKNNIGNKTYIDGHKILPFMTMDGVNDAGLAICMNEVSARDVGLNPGTDPKHLKGTTDLHVYMLVRYLLDYASNIEEAKTLLEEINIYNHSYQEMHFMLMDKTGHSSVVEFEYTDSTKAQKKAVWYDQSESSYYQGVSTNFPMTGYKGDAKTYYKVDSSLMNHAEGVERYNLLFDKLNSTTIKSSDDMLDLLKEAYYSKTYSIPLEDDSDKFWFSDFNNIDSEHIKTTPHKVSNYNTNYYKAVMNSYNNKSRTASTPFYVTKHSCCYDLSKLTLNLIYEENIKINKTLKIER